MIHILSLGVALGLSAGLTPGPLTALVIAETLRHDMRAGFKVAVAPLITDLPIIACSLLFLAKFAHAEKVLALISICGGIFVAKMGIWNLTLKGVKLDLEKEGGSSFRRGIVTNLLSPHPYLFWLTVGLPVMAQAAQHDNLLVIYFLLSFYLLLVGSKLILALFVGKSKTILSGKIYLRVMRFLGVVLCVFAVGLFREGVRLLFQ